MEIFEGKTVEEATRQGLAEMGITEEQAEITVLEEPTKGFLGFNAKKAKVGIEKKSVKTDGERAVEFIKGLLDKLEVSAECELVQESEKIIINLTTSDSAAVIGYRGEVLDAMQNMAGAIANKGRDDYRRVVVDCEGYRQKREETLISLANKLAAKAVKTGRKVVLEPMPAYERRILHSALSENTEVKTQSEGKEPNRYVAIIPNDLKSDGSIDGRRKSEVYRDRDRKGGYGKGDRKGGRRERDDAPRQPRPKTSGFGTFLGNSLKNGDKTE